MSPVDTFMALAVATPISAALSQVIFVVKSGSSCSQPLLANRPSKTFGQGKKVTSVPAAAAGMAGRLAEAVTLAGRAVVPSATPSWTA